MSEGNSYGRFDKIKAKAKESAVALDCISEHCNGLAVGKCGMCEVCQDQLGQIQVEEFSEKTIFGST